MRRDTRIIFTIPHNQYYQVVEWCVENFGRKHRNRWGHNFKLDAVHDTPTTFYINKKEDAMAFKLRWL